MTTIKQWLGPFWPIAVFSFIALVSLSASRVGLGVWQLERVDAVAGWPEMLLQGLRVDIATLCWIWGVPAMLTMLLAGPHAIGRAWLQLIRVWLTLGLWLMLFLEISTPSS